MTFLLFLFCGVLFFFYFFDFWPLSFFSPLSTWTSLTVVGQFVEGKETKVTVVWNMDAAGQHRHSWNGAEDLNNKPSAAICQCVDIGQAKQKNSRPKCWTLLYRGKSGRLSFDALIKWNFVFWPSFFVGDSTCVSSPFFFFKETTGGIQENKRHGRWICLVTWSRLFLAFHLVSPHWIFFPFYLSSRLSSNKQNNTPNPKMAAAWRN